MAIIKSLKSEENLQLFEIIEKRGKFCLEGKNLGDLDSKNRSQDIVGNIFY